MWEPLILATLKQKQAVEEAGVFHKKEGCVACLLLPLLFLSFTGGRRFETLLLHFCVTNYSGSHRRHPLIPLVAPRNVRREQCHHAASNVITPLNNAAFVADFCKKEATLGKRCYVVIFVLSHPRVEAKSRFFATLNCDKPKIQQKLVPKKKDALLVSATHAANRTARD